jgi:hypothetical protein
MRTDLVLSMNRNDRAAVARGRSFTSFAPETGEEG